MKADLTRNTFNPFKHFSGVLMQQGRIQLDADWNEQGSILLHYLRTLATDLIGEHGGVGGGFKISALDGASGDFQIGFGHYYVDGILCEAEGEEVAISFISAPNTIHVSQWTLDGKPFQDQQFVELFDAASPAPAPAVVKITNLDEKNQKLDLVGDNKNLGKAVNPRVRGVFTYATQPDFTATALSAGAYQVYLDVWERHITYIEDETIREVALGGPDTATRSKIVWQVKVTKPMDTCMTVRQLNDLFQPRNRGMMKAMAKQASIAADPCIIPPDANYRGAENQLYRVEIHRGGSKWDESDAGKTKAATFKWSRENGSVTFPIVSVAPGSPTSTVTLRNLGRDDRFGLAPDDWVELQNDDSVLQNQVGNLLQVQAIDRSSLKVTLMGTASSNIASDAAKHPLLRRWDYKEGDRAEGGLTLGSENAALIQESSGGAWLVLEDGIQIQFQPSEDKQSPNQYRTGDYWLIPARTATGDVEWPSATYKNAAGTSVTVPLAKPPDGVDHHYAPLAVINVGGPAGLVKADCRRQLQPLAK